MNVLDSTLGSMNFDWKDVFKGTPVLDERVLEHLRTTYVLLAVTAATASAGCAAAIFIPGMLWLMSGFIGRILCFAATSFLGAAVANSTVSSRDSAMFSQLRIANSRRSLCHRPPRAPLALHPGGAPIAGR